MPRRRVALLAFAIALLVAPAAQAKAPSILYAVDAGRATVTAGHGATRVAMPAAARVAWFTDRPGRRAGTTTLRVLASIWEASGFVADPPNAALLMAGADGERVHVVTLTAPRVEGRTVSFRVRRIAGASAAGHRDRDRVVAGAYGRTALFVDAAATPPCPGSFTVAGSGSCLLAAGATLAAYGSPAFPAEVDGCLPPGSAAYGLVQVLGQGEGPETVFVSPCSSGVPAAQLAGVGGYAGTAPATIAAAVYPGSPPPQTVLVSYGPFAY